MASALHLHKAILPGQWQPWTTVSPSTSFGLITLKYHEILKISPRAYIFQRPFLRGLCTEGSLPLRIDWAVAYSWQIIYLFCFFCFVF